MLIGALVILLLLATSVLGGRLAFLLTGTALLIENNPRIDASDFEEGRYRLRAALTEQIADLEDMLEIVGE